MFLLLTLATSASAEPLTLTAGQSRTVPVFGVTAAWSIDTNVVVVAAQQGNVMLFARGAGRTTIVIVTATGEHAYEVVVGPNTRSAPIAAKPGPDRASAEVRYSSAAREVQSSVAIAREDDRKRVQAELRTAHRSGEPIGDRARTSITGATYRVFTRGRELTIFDRDVDHSPLTLDATPLRGIHYRDDQWRLHAGYTAYAAYRSFLVPVERQLVAGGGYAFRTGARSTLTPSIFAIRGEGSVASLLYDYDHPDRLIVRGEIGYSRGLGGAADVSWDGAADRVRAAIRHRPEDFAIAGTATPRGFFGDASWTHDYGRESNTSLSWSATDVLGLRVIHGTAGADHRLSDTLALTGGASWATYDGRETINVPAGIRIDRDRMGLAVLYRYARAFNNEGGHGFRVSGRVTRGRVYASAFADRQRNAPTLELIFSERPDLALALAELGIVATSPADIARALREHATLRALGFIDGVTLHLAPERTQFGAEVAWLGTSRSRQQLRARVLRNVTESVGSRATTLIATLSYSRRIADATDVFGSYTYWRTESSAGITRVQPFVEAGLRRRFDTVPSFLGGKGTISGVVFLDEDLDGRSDGRGVTAEVELDGVRRMTTRDDGSFAFHGVAHGAHRVVARVPKHPEAYFTTASRVEAQPGDRVAFGIATTPACVFGRVLDDAGSGVASVRLLLARGAQQVVSTSASDGRFTFAAAPGEWQLSIVRDSIPAGYSLTTGDARTVTLRRDQPLHVSLALTAHRTISGRAAPHAQIEVQPHGQRLQADETGRFAIRSLSPGVVTLTTGDKTQRVEVPDGPAAIEIDLEQ